MRTKEFIKKVEELGYDVELYPSHVVITTSNISVATVYTQKLYEINTCSIVKVELTHKEELFDLIIKYAKTPIDERKEPKTYYLRHRWMDGAYGQFLNKNLEYNCCILEDKEDTWYKKSTFSLREIDEIKEKYKTDLSDFEMVEVEE